jgi:methylglyoxal synthase
MTSEKPVVGLVAHDDRKQAMVDWAGTRLSLLSRCKIVATGTTGGRLADAHAGLDITRLRSGPLGGDQQLGAMIAEERIDALVFFVDALSPHPHDVDVKALIRLATLGNILFATNQASADAVLDALEKRLAHELRL